MSNDPNQNLAGRIEGLSAAKMALLAQRLKAAQSIPEAASANVIPKISRARPIPASFSQERMWLNYLLNPCNFAYNSQVALHFKGSLDVNALRQTLNEIVRRHEICRTHLCEEEGRILQRILPITEAPLCVEQCEASALRVRINEVISTPFQLDVGPLVRWTLLVVDDRTCTLVFTDHHAVTDGWSRRVVFREMMALYRYFHLQDTPYPLQPPGIQFADFAVWQRNWLLSNEGRSQLDYWQKQLAGCPQLLDLPLDFPRPASPSYEGGHDLMEVAISGITGLKSLVESEQVTMYMVFLAGFFTLLHRYSRATDICVGTGIANRRMPQTDDLVGMVINTVVLRADMSGDPTFREFLGRIRALTFDAYAHQEAPFDKVVEAINPIRNPAINPLHQVTFNFQNNPMPAVELEGVETELERPLFNGSAKYDLYVAGWPRSFSRNGDWQRDDETVVLSWEFNRDVFQLETIQLLQKQFRNLLNDAVARPEKRLSELELGVVRAPESGVNPAEEGCLIHERFSALAADHPARVALECGAAKMTYADLDTRSSSLALKILQVCPEPGMVIGLAGGRSMDTVVGMLGILKAGAAYVPVEAEIPSGLDLQLIVGSGKPSGWPEGKFVSIPNETQTGASVPPSHCSGDSPAYVMFTSGSTGQPRAVIVPHRAVMRLVSGQDFAQMTLDQTWLLHSPLTFDASTLEIWAPLCNGGRLVIAPTPTPSLDELGEMIASNGVNSLWLTSGLFRLMVEQRPDFLGLLQQLLTGGDVVPVASVKRLRSMFPGLNIINGYGPTENTTFTCCQVIEDADLQRRSIPIGRAIRGTTAYVMDAKARICPTGVPGELWTGGDGLALGYLNDPEETQRRFVQHPSLGRLYRTGDLCRVLPDGRIEFLGRLDRQLKVSGVRIEPAAIEQKIESIVGVKLAAVIAQTDASGDKTLIACIVAASEPPDITTEAIRREAASLLPQMLLPSRWILLQEMPLTPNGKVDYDALPTDSSGPVQAVRPPVTVNEKLVASIWSDVLGLHVNDVHADFFALGGHSLAALRILALIRERSGASLTAAQFFHDPTLRGIAEAIDFSNVAAPTMVLKNQVLIPLRKNHAGPMVLFIPGGWGEENEILVFAQLVRQMRIKRPIYAARSGVLCPDFTPAPDLRAHAARLVDALALENLCDGITLIGECAASTVALSMHEELESRGHKPSGIILLDPGSPDHLRSVQKRIAAPREGQPSMLEELPGAVVHYYSLLGQVSDTALRTPIHIVLSARFPGTADILNAWKQASRAEVHMHRVPGDHHSYLREMSMATAAELDRILGSYLPRT